MKFAMPMTPHQRGRKSLRKDMELGFKKKYASLDSCAILRTMLGDNSEQEKRIRRLILSGQLFYVDDVAIMECVYVLTKEGCARSEIAELLQCFLSNPMIYYARAFFAQIFKDYVSHPSLSFDDLVLAARVEEKGCVPLWTFDKKLAHQSKIAKLVA